MNRRELFALLAGAVVAPTELLIPSRKIFLPPRGGWVSDQNIVMSLRDDLMRAIYNVDPFSTPLFNRLKKVDPYQTWDVYPSG